MTERDVADAIETLAARYDEPWRHYHDRRHVHEMLDALRALTDGPLHPALTLAAWAHDAVYDPRAGAGENERHSAEVARDVLTDAGIPPEVTGEVVDLTLATITHEPIANDGPDGPDARRRCAAFLDADLWILAAPATRFAEYERQIRAEYAFVPQDLYDRTRREILGTFARRPRLYLTEQAQRDWEPAARHNLSTIGHHSS